MDSTNTEAGPSRDAVEACLRKVLSSPAFANSERLASFLRYVVTETLEGRADRVKGYAIAVSVFDCGAQFDPQTNSVVRVEATRLRKRLEEYYAEAGKYDPVEIRINRGTYVPIFLPRGPDAAAAGETAAADAPEAAEALAAPEAAPAKRLNPAYAALAALALLGGVAWFAWPPPRQAPPQPATGSERFAAAPSVTVKQPENHSDGLVSAKDALALGIELAGALGRFDDIKAYDGTVEDPGNPSEYRLTSLVRSRDGRISVLFRLLRNADSQVVWARSYDTASGTMDATARTSMVAAAVTALARTGGVILSDRFAQMPPLSSATTGFSCIVHAAKYPDAPSPERHRDAVACLERTIAANPKSARAHATLAMLILDGRIRNYAHQDMASALVRASAAANEAISLAPQSALSHLALFMARFHDRRFEDARESAERALALNPYSIEIKARIGSAHILRGEFDTGMALLRQGSNGEHIPAWLEFYHFLDAYMRNDMDKARRHAGRSTTTRTPLGLVAKIAAAVRDRDSEAAARWAQMMREQFPRFTQDIPGAFERLSMAKAIRTPLLADLAAAGLAAAP